jgi:hypothetical protein
MKTTPSFMGVMVPFVRNFALAFIHCDSIDGASASFSYYCQGFKRDDCGFFGGGREST